MPIFAVNLASTTDTVSSHILFNRYELIIYLPKVGCNSCGHKDVEFVESFLHLIKTERVALITHLVNVREQRLLEQRLGIRVYRVMNHRAKLFGNKTHMDGMIFRPDKRGNANKILRLHYNKTDVITYCRQNYKLD